MPYNFCADCFHTKKHCSTISEWKVHFLRECHGQHYNSRTDICDIWKLALFGYIAYRELQNRYWCILIQSFDLCTEYWKQFSLGTRILIGFGIFSDVEAFLWYCRRKNGGQNYLWQDMNRIIMQYDESETYVQLKDFTLIRTAWNLELRESVVNLL